MNSRLLILIVFLGSITFFGGIGMFMMAWFSSERAVVEKRVRSFFHHSSQPGFQEQAVSFLKKESDWRKYALFSDFPPLLNLPHLFEQAGMSIDVSRWFFLIFCTAIVLSLIIWLMTFHILLTLSIAIGSFLFPYLGVLIRRRSRLTAFDAGLAQSLEILGRSLRAGHPLTMGLQMVASEMPDPIQGEFGRVYYEQQMGLPLDESLKRMAQRVPLLDLRFFVLSVLIHQQTGGDLAEILDNLSHVVRDRFKVLGQVKALTAEGRLSGWVLSVLPIGVFLIICTINPKYSGILTQTPIGQKMLTIAGLLQVVGMVLIQKIVRIKV